MNSAQKIIKGFAIAFAITLIVGIFYSIFCGIFTLGRIFGNMNSNNQEVQIYTETFDITPKDIDIYKIEKLQIESSLASLNIIKSDEFKVLTNSSEIVILDTEDTIIIKENENHNNFFNVNDFIDKELKLTIYIPENKKFEDVMIDTGIGEANIDNIIAKKAIFNFGVGKVKITNVEISKKTEITAGTGKVDILNSIFKDLNANLGVGKFCISGVISGNSKIDAGIGAVELNLIDGIANYTIDLEKGIGQIVVNGNPFLNNGNFGNGSNYIKIDGGIGSITVK